MRALAASPLEGRQPNARVEETTTATSRDVLARWKSNAQAQNPSLHQAIAFSTANRLARKLGLLP